MKKLGSIKRLGSVGLGEAPISLGTDRTITEPDPNHAATALPGEGSEQIGSSPELLTSAVFDPLCEKLLSEKYGDKPEWMKISGYRFARHPDSHKLRGELMLSLSGKKYWFPVAPRVYEAFLGKIVGESRGAGLRYLQSYIRQYRGYKERWPSARYVKANKMHKDSFMRESQKDLQELASSLGTDGGTVMGILSLHDEGRGVYEIARKLNVSVHLIERTLNLFKQNKEADISEVNIPKGVIDGVADGLLTFDQALKSVSEAVADKRVMTALDKVRDNTRRESLRIKGMKPRAPTYKIGRNSV